MGKDRTIINNKIGAIEKGYLKKKKKLRKNYFSPASLHLQKKITTKKLNDNILYEPERYYQNSKKKNKENNLSLLFNTNEYSPKEIADVISILSEVYQSICGDS